jgi:hypothetical protein
MASTCTLPPAAYRSSPGDAFLAARDDEIALHLARDRNLPAGEKRITRDRGREIHHAANADMVVADLAVDAVLLVTIDADGAAADGRQAKRRERYDRNEPGHRRLLRAQPHLAAEPGVWQAIADKFTAGDARAASRCVEPGVQSVRVHTSDHQLLCCGTPAVYSRRATPSVMYPAMRGRPRR